MNMTNYVIISLYSAGIIAALYVHTIRHGDKTSLRNRLFRWMLRVTILLLIADLFGRFDGRPGTLYPILNHVGNLSLYFLEVVLGIIWMLYVYASLHEEEDRIPVNLARFLVIVCGVHTTLLIASQHNGWYYSISAENIYQRGPLFPVAIGFSLLLIVVPAGLVIRRKATISKSNFIALLLFPVPPLIGIILQTAFYGVVLINNGIVLSLLILHLYAQSRNIHTDYLTDIGNRKRLDLYMRDKILSSTEGHTFSAILLDLNCFKSINDTYGHNEGDEALRNTADLLQHCLRERDFIARYGGDEFCMILDMSDPDRLKDVAKRIQAAVERYNSSSGKPYRLEFSMGCAVYDTQSSMNLQAFQKHIDNLMYEDKKRMKAIDSNG